MFRPSFALLKVFADLCFYIFPQQKGSHEYRYLSLMIHTWSLLHKSQSTKGIWISPHDWPLQVVYQSHLMRKWSTKRTSKGGTPESLRLSHWDPTLSSIPKADIVDTNNGAYRESHVLTKFFLEAFYKVPVVGRETLGKNLHDLIPKSWYYIYTQSQLPKMVCGSDSNLSLGFEGCNCWFTKTFR